MSAFFKDSSESSKKDRTVREASLRLLKSSIYGLGWRYWAFFASTILFSLVLLLPPQLFRFFTESAQNIQSMRVQEFLYELAVFGGWIALAMFVSAVGSAWCQEWLRLKIEAQFRRKVLRKLHQTPLTVIEKAQRGDWLTRMTSDLHEAEIFVAESIPGQIRNISLVVGAAALFLFYSGNLALIPIVAALVIAVANVVVQRRLAPVLRQLRQCHGDVFQVLIENLEGIRTVRTHGAERFILKGFDQKLRTITRKGMGVAKTFGVLTGSTRFVTQAMITVILSVMTLALGAGELTVHQVLAYPFFIGVFYSSVQALAASAYDWNRFFADAGRLAELLYGPNNSSLPSAKVPIRLNDRVSKMVCEDVVVGYPNKPLTTGIRHEFSTGRVTALVGPSGCGKSTFLETLAGLRPAQSGVLGLYSQEGETLWHSGASQSNAELPVGLCAYVEQRPYIFEGSLRENLTLGSKDGAKDEELLQALERVGLTKFAEEAGGLDYRLHDRGDNLSEGQRYRLALSRALLLKRPFLLLDEPFAALDSVSAQFVSEALSVERKRVGVIIVTHYLPKALEIDELISFEQFSLSSQLPNCAPVVGWQVANSEAGELDKSFKPASGRAFHKQQSGGGDDDQGNRTRGLG